MEHVSERKRDDLSPLQEPVRAINVQVQELLNLFEQSFLVHETENKVTKKAKEWKEKVEEKRHALLKNIKTRQKQVKRKFQEKSVEIRVNFKKQLRSTITGDPNRSLRRHIQEAPQIKFIDKACFTFSIMHLIFTELFVLKFTQYFKDYYAIMLVLLMLARYVTYKSKQYHYFMLDFCYFVNFLVILHAYVVPFYPNVCLFIISKNMVFFFSFFFLHHKQIEQRSNHKKQKKRTIGVFNILVIFYIILCALSVCV